MPKATKPTTEPAEQLAFRFPPELVKRLKQHAQRFERETGLKPSLTAIVKLLLERALDDVEASDKRRGGKS